jgi:malate dehydrogenase (quinone)
VMLDILTKCFASRLPGWSSKLEEMIPSFGQSLANDPGLYRKVRSEADAALRLV